MSIVWQCIQFLRSSFESRFIGAERNVSYDSATSNLGENNKTKNWIALTSPRLTPLCLARL